LLKLAIVGPEQSNGRQREHHRHENFEFGGYLQCLVEIAPRLRALTQALRRVTQESEGLTDLAPRHDCSKKSVTLLQAFQGFGILALSQCYPTQYEPGQAHPPNITSLPGSIKTRLSQRTPFLVLTQMYLGKAQRDAHIRHPISNAQVVPDGHALLQPRVTLHELAQHHQSPARTTKPICPFSLVLLCEGNRATLPNQVFSLLQSSLAIGNGA
jgi:hypothetical protein